MLASGEFSADWNLFDSEGTPRQEASPSTSAVDPFPVGKKGFDVKLQSHRNHFAGSFFTDGLGFITFFRCSTHGLGGSDLSQWNYARGRLEIQDGGQWYADCSGSRRLPQPGVTQFVVEFPHGFGHRVNQIRHVQCRFPDPTGGRRWPLLSIGTRGLCDLPLSFEEASELPVAAALRSVAAYQIELHTALLEGHVVVIGATTT